MPPIEEADMIHRAVVWRFLRMDRDNEPVLDAPKEYKCQWVNVYRLTKDDMGRPIELTAEAAFPCQIPVRSLVWQGRLEEWEDSGDKVIHEVSLYENSSSIHGKNERYEYGLTLWRDSLPPNTPEPGD